MTGERVRGFDLSALDAALRRARVPAHYRHALLAEMAAHADDHAAALQADGVALAEARTRAVAALGAADLVADAAAAHAAAWPHRAPTLVLVFAPVVVFAVAAALAGPLVLACVGQDAAVELSLVEPALRLLAAVLALATVLSSCAPAHATPASAVTPRAGRCS